MAKQKMVKTCQKCGHQEESEYERVDRGACPKCGVHGKITLANSKPVVVKGKTVAFVPAN